MSTQSESRLLMTGVTGFVGSSLAARFLAEGKEVTALVRNDPKSHKAISAIRKGAHTLGLSLPESAFGRLTVVNGALSDIGKVLSRELLDSISETWHLAALLSYRMSGLPRSLDANLVATAELYRLVALRAPRCRRFYHVSTAYCVGFPEPGKEIPETVHDFPRHPNAYQLTKWAAEMSLRNASLGERLPVTILRPSIVVGNSRTGAYHGDPFGLYMFFYAAHRFLGLRQFRDLRLPPETDGTINLVPIDVLTQNIARLAGHEGPERAAFEVFHVCGTTVPAAWVAKAGGDAAGIHVTFERPRSVIDRLFAGGIEENRLFAAHVFRFEERRLPALLGSEYVPTFIDEKTLFTLTREYLRRLDAEHRGLWVPAVARPLLPWLARPGGKLGEWVARWVRKRLEPEPRHPLAA